MVAFSCVLFEELPGFAFGDCECVSHQLNFFFLRSVVATVTAPSVPIITIFIATACMEAPLKSTASIALARSRMLNMQVSGILCGLQTCRRVELAVL